MKPSAHPNPMPSENWVSPSAISIQVSYLSWGDLLEYLMACKNIWVETC